MRTLRIYGAILLPSPTFWGAKIEGKTEVEFVSTWF
jgi:hypothetical protein